MNATFNLTLKTTGMVLVVLGLFMIPPLFMSIFTLDKTSSFAFIFSILFFVILGYTFATQTEIRYKSLFYTRESIIILSCSWLAACFAGGVPYLAADVISHPLDAFFESCSGFTTTGATVFSSVESLPASILLWRSITQWLGGVGIVIFALILTPSLFIDGTGIAYNDMYRSAMPNSFNKTFNTVLAVVSVYFGLTVLQILLLWISGMSTFDSIIFSLGTISTGGFSNHDEGLLFFSGAGAKIIIAVFMAFCGLSANWVYNSYRRSKFIVLGNSENNLYWLIIILASFTISLKLVYSIDQEVISSIGNAIFQVISTVTTTGYASSDYTFWPAFCISVMIILMLVGGCSLSVSGGNKMIRGALLIKLVVHGIETRLHPKAITPIKINRVDLPRDRINAVANHTFLFITVFFAGAFIIALEGFPISTCITFTISLLSNSGISFDLFHPGTICNIAECSQLTKICSCLLMLAGRLELYNLIVIFTPSFWRSE